METIIVELPASLREFVRQRTEQGDYSTASEYVCELILRDQRRSAQTLLETDLLRGLTSGPAEELTKEHWANIRTAVRQKIKGRKRS